MKLSDLIIQLQAQQAELDYDPEVFTHDGYSLDLIQWISNADDSPIEWKMPDEYLVVGTFV